MNDARKQYIKSRRYYRKLLKERISNYIQGTLEIILALVIIVAHFQLIYLALTSDGHVDRLNECYKAHSYNYCQNNIK